MIRPRKSKLSPEELRENQEKFNASISSSIAGIFRYSLDAQFREKCFDMMKVDNTNDLEAAIKKHLDILSHIRPMSPTINLKELDQNSDKKDGSNESEDMITTNIALEESEKEENRQVDLDHNSEDLENNEFWPGVECFEWTSSKKSVTELSIITKEMENEEMYLENECFQWNTSKIVEPERNEELNAETQKNAEDILLLKDVVWE